MSEEAFKQPALDDNLSRPLNPKTQTEITRSIRAYTVAEFANGRYGVVQVLIDPKKAEKMTVFGHLEEEKEFADQELLKTLTFAERIRV